MTVEEYRRHKNNEYTKRRYFELVNDHRCGTCGRQDERTLAGYTRCAECYAKAYRKTQVKTDAQKRRGVQRKKELRQKRAEEWRCKWCGNQDYLTLRGRPLCASCQRLRDRYDEDYKNSGAAAVNRKRRRDMWREQGLCTNCGKNPPEPGRMTCTDCLVRKRISRRMRRHGNAG